MDGIAQGLKLTVDKALVFALQLAEKGKGFVEPNPCVGCVLLDDDSNVLGYGFHERFGEAHAEVNAFKDVLKEGLTAIVTLEPCSHTGKTGPCAEFLKSKKIKKLVYIDDDPNPEVSGKGIKILKEAGIKVEKAPESYSKINHMLNSKFFYYFYNKKTFFHAKWAQSLDGKMSLNGESKWITNEKSRAYAHFLRAQSEAVIVGKNTILNDDPLLNPRLPGFTKNNKVVIIDPNLELIESLKSKKIASVRDAKDIILVHSSNNDTKNKDGFRLLKIENNNDGLIDLNTLKTKLASEFKIQSAFVEGGPKTLSLFLKSKTINFASAFIASKIFGSDADSYSDDLKISDLSNCFEIATPVIRTIDSDTVLEGALIYF